MHADLKDTVALVTGASGGIGQATAVELAGCGADLAVHYHRNAEGAAETVRRVEALGRRAQAFQADVSEAAASRKLVAEVLGAFGRVDLLDYTPDRFSFVISRDTVSTVSPR